MISTKRQTTLRTLMPALAQCLWCARSADACLARAARVNFNKLAPGTLSLVRDLVHKFRPSSIIDGLRQHSFSESLDVQIFNSNKSVVINKPSANLVMKVCALIRNVKMYTRQKLHSFAATVRTFLTPHNLALRASQLCFGFF